MLFFERALFFCLCIAMCQASIDISPLPILDDHNLKIQKIINEKFKIPVSYVSMKIILYFSVFYLADQKETEKKGTK